MTYYPSLSLWCTWINSVAFIGPSQSTGNDHYRQGISQYRDWRGEGSVRKVLEMCADSNYLTSPSIPSISTNLNGLRQKFQDYRKFLSSL
ncbi:hypothetical protein GDO81_017272 [Engystomops pustulosus]|uniref:Uncharacterized protein n=1 Tax=Engystomops pustulosus TaxID=76066 RepID=A0AAV7AIN4_ENGPU|nr:hypothetical protein GDO81_017272 [Engystomops pustulosus]